MPSRKKVDPVAFDNVEKTYTGRTVLSHASFSVSPGEMVAFTGPSGSGKSTILNLAGLLDSPDAGEVRLFGTTAPRPRSRDATPFLRHRLGYLFQNFALIDSATVRENLKVALTYSSDRSDHAKQIARILERVGLPGYENRRVYSLSGGEQQRVAIARLWLKPCELVLADEPTGSLDENNRDEIVKLLREMSADGRTLLLATHDLRVAEICTRTVEVASLSKHEGTSNQDAGHEDAHS